MDKSFGHKVKDIIPSRLDEESEYDFYQINGHSIDKLYSVKTTSLAEAVKWYETSKCVELIISNFNDSDFLSKDILRIDGDNNSYYVYKREVEPYYIIMNSSHNYLENIKSDLTGKDFEFFGESMQDAAKYKTIEDAKHKIDSMSIYEQWINQNFAIIKCAKRNAIFHCGDSNFIIFNEWHYKCEGNKDDRSRNNNEDEG